MMPYVVRPLDPWFGPLTANRRQTPFSATWTTTLDLLDREIWMLGGRTWVLQIDVEERWINRDGTLSARANPRSPAIRVCFESRHGPLMYAADRFDRWQANVRAVALSLEALRKVDRYGVANSGEQYRGWQAISSQPATMTRTQAAEFIHHWADEPLITPADILRDQATLTRAYRLAAKRTHPDVTGDLDTFKRLNVARDLIVGAA